jgi:hypothetical protein
VKAFVAASVVANGPCGIALNASLCRGVFAAELVFGSSAAISSGVRRESISTTWSAGTVWDGMVCTAPRKGTPKITERAPLPATAVALNAPSSAWRAASEGGGVECAATRNASSAGGARGERRRNSKRWRDVGSVARGGVDIDVEEAVHELAQTAPTSNSARSLRALWAARSDRPYFPENRHAF